MNFLGAIIKQILSKKALSGSEQNRFFTSSRASGGSQFSSPQQFLDAYHLVNYVGTAVDTIAGDIASLDWKLVDNNGQEAEDASITELLRQPMPGMSWNNWIARSTKHLLLDGNVFWLKDINNAFDLSKNNISELKLLNPALVRVHDTQGEEIRATTSKISLGVGFYRVEINNSFIQIDPENICQAQLPSPNNELRGMGKVQMNSSTMDAERLTAVFTNAFFKQGASLNYAITPDPEMGRGEFERYKTELRGEYQGQNNISKLFITPPGSKIQALSSSQRDMEFIDQKKLSRADIYAFFGVPPIVSGNLEMANYDSASEQLKSYYDINLPRYYKVLEGSINKIVRDLNPNITFKFIPKNIVDKEIANAISRDLFDRGAITGNEYRERLEIPRDNETDSLDQYWINTNLLPAGFASSEDFLMPETDAGGEAKNVTQSENTDNTGECDNQSHCHVHGKDAVQTKATKKQLQLHFIARNTKMKIEKSFEKMTKKFYKSMEERVLSGVKGLDQINTKEPNIDDAFNFEEEIEEARLTATKVFTSAVALSINDINEFLGAEVDTSFSNPDVRLVVEKLKTRYADLTINSRREEVRAIIQRGIDEALSVSQIKGELQDYFTTLNGKDAWRAQRIARTEASYAWDQAAELGYKDLGVTEIDVVGCEDAHGPWDCNQRGFKVSEIPDLNFHPNHTGTTVPSRI